MSWPRVLIAGGSIGGLTTGLLLRDLGCEVDIFERATDALEDRGAGIVVLPVTERYLAERRPEDKRVSLELRFWTYVDESGRVVSADPDRYRFAGWSSMYRALLDAFGRERYHFSSEVVGFSTGSGAVAAKLADGSIVEGDLLVFADGFGSTGRSLLLPEVTPEYAGYVAWRGTVPESRLSGSARDLLADSMVYQVLDRSHVLVYAIPGRTGQADPHERLINFVWYRNYPRGGPYEDLMTDRDGVVRSGTMPPGSIREDHLVEMESLAADVLAPPLFEIVSKCREPLIQAVFDLASPRMGFGRAAILGDAAFTLRPHIAAGQAKACADAWALHDAVSACGGDVEAALSRWEPGQLALGNSALERARAMGTASQYAGTMVAGDPKWKFGLWEPGN